MDASFYGQPFLGQPLLHSLLPNFVAKFNKYFLFHFNISIEHLLILILHTIISIKNLQINNLAAFGPKYPRYFLHSLGKARASSAFLSLHLRIKSEPIFFQVLWQFENLIFSVSPSRARAQEGVEGEGMRPRERRGLIQEFRSDIFQNTPPCGIWLALCERSPAGLRRKLQFFAFAPTDSRGGDENGQYIKRKEENEILYLHP